MRKSTIGYAWLLAACFAGSPAAADLAIDWHTVDGGGGTSSGGSFTLSGTVGQPDAGTMSGGTFTLHGGFWGAVAAVQTPGAPLLTVSLGPTNTVQVAWIDAGSDWRLQWTASLSTKPVVWTDSAAPCTTNAATIMYSEVRVFSARFYRLHKP